MPSALLSLLRKVCLAQHFPYRCGNLPGLEAAGVACWRSDRGMAGASSLSGLFS